MQQLVRIVYISRSTFGVNRSTSGIEPNVGRILLASRINNRRDGLVGVLYFGDGCFFQCLEGQQSAVDGLYARLQLDGRHKDIKLLSRENIDAVTYADWAMKFVPLQGDMTRLLHEAGFKLFNPYLFSSVMVNRVMDLLRTSTDSTTDKSVEALIEQSVAESTSRAASRRAVFREVTMAAIVFLAGVAVGRLPLP